MGRRSTKNLSQTTQTAPSDWSTNYNDYFTIKSLNELSGNFPAWKLNTYYYKYNSSLNTYRALNNKPDNWDSANWSNNAFVFIQNDFPKCPPDWEPKTFYFNQNNKFLLTEEEPENWKSNSLDLNWTSYYIRNNPLDHNSSYSKCSDVFKVPDWNASLYYKRKPLQEIQRSITHTGVVVAYYTNNSSTNL